MFGQIIRYLWNCRRHNLWIMIELIVITIVSWMVIDPLFVLNYNRGIPDGYDVDGLYRLQLMRNPEDTVSNPADDYRLIMQKLRNIPSVDAATCVLRGAYPSSPGMNANNIVKDTVAITTTCSSQFLFSERRICVLLWCRPRSKAHTLLSILNRKV